MLAFNTTNPESIDFSGKFNLYGGVFVEHLLHLQS